VKTKLDLSVRTYICTECGLVLDRDLNAARNLAVLGEVMIAGSGPETVNGRGGVGVLPLPVKRQPGTAQAGNTGTVQPQGRTAVRELTNTHLHATVACSSVGPAVARALLKNIPVGVRDTLTERRDLRGVSNDCAGQSLDLGGVDTPCPGRSDSELRWAL
jgi:hypothetical protein